MSVSDDYLALREKAVLGAIAERRQVAVAGADRAGFLQGLLTNDIAGLKAGTGCYAAWLTPQGRMLTDMHVLESGGMLLLDVPAAEVQAIVERLEQFHFTEDVRIENLANSLRSVWLHGPHASTFMTKLVSSTGTGTGQPFDAWGDYQNARVDLDGTNVVVARIDQLGVPGYVLYVHAEQEADLTRALAAAGACPATQETIDAARVEAGYPVFGVDMTTDTIPLEADIQDRAISLTKGCYVGQEVIIRVLHRGHGRVARKLAGLLVRGVVPAPGAKILVAGREVGFVTSAAHSPRLGPIALGYVHRDFIEPGTVVEIENPAGGIPATVRALSTS